MKINEIIEPRDVERPISKDYNIEKMGQRPEDFNEFGAYANGIHWMPTCTERK